jgi:hypothetical protein
MAFETVEMERFNALASSFKFIDNGFRKIVDG